MWQESYYLKVCTSPAELITSESSSTDLSDEEATNGKLRENFRPVFGDMPKVVITKESFQILDSIYSQMVAEIIVIIFYYVTFKDVLKCFINSTTLPTDTVPVLISPAFDHLSWFSFTEN